MPTSPNKPAVSTQQGVRADEERLLARSPQKPTGCSEEDTIGVLQTRAGDLAAKNRKLMSKHNDLELLELTRTQTQRSHRERTPNNRYTSDTNKGRLPPAGCERGPDSTAAKSPPTRLRASRRIYAPHTVGMEL